MTSRVANLCMWRSRGEFDIISAAAAIFYLPNPTSTKMSRFSHNSRSSFSSSWPSVRLHVTWRCVQSDRRGSIPIPSRKWRRAGLMWRWRKFTSATYFAKGLLEILSTLTTQQGHENSEGGFFTDLIHLVENTPHTPSLPHDSQSLERAIYLNDWPWLMRKMKANSNPHKTSVRGCNAPVL